MRALLSITLALLIASCGRKITPVSYVGSVNTSNYNKDSLAAPFATPSSKNFSRVVGWHDGEKPITPQNFSVDVFATGLNHPRWIYIAPNKDIFVAESNTVLKGILKLGAHISRKIKTQHYGTSADRIILFRDTNGDGFPDKKYVYADHMKQPFGMLVLNDGFYVANTNALLRFNYNQEDTAVHSEPTKIIDLPVGKVNQHWTRNIISNNAHNKILIAIGAATNLANKGLDNEKLRANIIEINPDGSGERIYASGLRNPVGMAWYPGTNVLWTAVNERDEIGDELVPDYLTHVQEGGFYGWPFAYWGAHEDPRMKEQQRPDLVQKTIVPDVGLGSHTASLGLIFYSGHSFPEKYRGGAFVTQHGSWNRSVLSGYKVVFVPFKNGKPGNPEDFLTGFIGNLQNSDVHGRPVGIAELPDGSLLISDDVNNMIWRIRSIK